MWIVKVFSILKEKISMLINSLCRVMFDIVDVCVYKEVWCFGCGLCCKNRDRGYSLIF